MSVAIMEIIVQFVPKGTFYNWINASNALRFQTVNSVPLQSLHNVLNVFKDTIYKIKHAQNVPYNVKVVLNKNFVPHA